MIILIALKETIESKRIQSQVMGWKMRMGVG